MMGEPVWIALIVAAQSVMVAMIGVMATVLGKVRKDTRSTRDNVVNDHDTNMREENDVRHEQVRKALLWLGGIAQETSYNVSMLKAYGRENRVRIEGIEDTLGSTAQPETRRARRTVRPVIEFDDIPGNEPWMI